MIRGQAKHYLRVSYVKIRKYLMGTARANFSEFLGNIVWDYLNYYYF